MQDLREENLKRQLRALQKQEGNWPEQMRKMRPRDENSQRQLAEIQKPEDHSQRQLREMQQREENLQRQLTEIQQREENLQRQLREIQQRDENSQRQLGDREQQLTNCQIQILELESSLSTFQQTLINQMHRHDSDCDWVIARHEIQMADNCLGRGGWGSVYEGVYCGCAVAVKKIHDLVEGDIGGYPIPQNRKKKRYKSKYRVENRLNTDTAYFNHFYNGFPVLMVASI